MFRDSFKKRRCLIPASGYYEWRETPEGKQPYYFTRRDGQIISIVVRLDRQGQRSKSKILHDARASPKL